MHPALYRTLCRPENDLFATDFQYRNMLHDVAFRRIIRDFDRAVQPRQGQCTPDRPHGHWVCPANLIQWKFDPEMVVNLTRPSDDWLSSTFNVFAATDDDEEGLQRQRVRQSTGSKMMPGKEVGTLGRSMVCLWCAVGIGTREIHPSALWTHEVTGLPIQEHLVGET